MKSEIRRIALDVIRKHGMTADAYAMDRARNALHKGDHLAWQLWSGIKSHIAEFLKLSGETHDTMH